MARQKRSPIEASVGINPIYVRVGVLRYHPQSSDKKCRYHPFSPLIAWWVTDQMLQSCLLNLSLLVWDDPPSRPMEPTIQCRCSSNGRLVNQSVLNDTCHIVCLTFWKAPSFEGNPHVGILLGTGRIRSSMDHRHWMGF